MSEIYIYFSAFCEMFEIVLLIITLFVFKLNGLTNWHIRAYMTIAVQNSPQMFNSE